MDSCATCSGRAVQLPNVKKNGSRVSTFTERELEYLKNQPLMRFATASPEGKPDVAPVVFSIEGDDVVTGGFDITRTVRYKNVSTNPRATIVIDDLASTNPWSPRGIKVVGSVVFEIHEEAPRFRISPQVIISWGINDTTPGIPKMERRVVETMGIEPTTSGLQSPRSTN